MKAKLELHTLTETLIVDIKKRHYLGSSNLRTNPTGDLNGYYRNIAFQVYSKFGTTKSAINPLFYNYLMAACIEHSGAGNCGEMSAALYLDLMLSDLPLSSKKMVQGKVYASNDKHENNSYVLVDDKAYDIWSGKKYKKSRIKAETGVDDKKHSDTASIDIDKMSVEQIKTSYESILRKFAKFFDDIIAEDRRTGRLYVTLNTNDSSDFAILASATLPYLFKKFVETLEDAYYVEHAEIASKIQNKIIKDLIYLIEELRQDFLKESKYQHPGRKKYSQSEIQEALANLIPNKLFCEFILAMSYKNVDPKQALAQLKEVSNQETPDALAKGIVVLAREALSTLESIATTAEKPTTPANAFFQPDTADTSTNSGATLISGMQQK